MKDETKVLVWAGVALIAFHAVLFILGWRLQRSKPQFKDASQDAQNGALQASGN